MTYLRLTFAAVFLLASGCAEEKPSYTVEDFMADRILLEATMVRCGQDRSAGRYDPNCAAARDAVDRIAAAEAKAQREALAAESERKREALRRARNAADERRRRAEEAERQRRQAEEFGIFEPLPDGPAGEGAESAPDTRPPGDPATDPAFEPPQASDVAPALPEPTPAEPPADAGN